MRLRIADCGLRIGAALLVLYSSATAQEVKKITQLPEASSIAGGDFLLTVTNPGGSAATKKITLSNFKGSLFQLTGTLPNAWFPSTLPAVSGVNLTNLNAASLASGTVPGARFPSTLPAINGSLLTNLNGSAIASGTVPVARLPIMVGDSGSGGTAGLAPAPAAGDGAAGKFLNASGGYTVPAGGAVSSVFSRTGAVTAATNDYTWAQVNKTTSSLADVTTRSASDLSSGTLPDARFPATLPAASGVNLTGLTKSQVGLGSVENTAMSTWAGSANITTLGTIASGAWAGSVIGPAYLGTGTRDGTRFLRDDGTYQTVSAGVSGANPTASVGLTAVNGSASTFLRSDGAPALDLGIIPTWTGIHTWGSGLARMTSPRVTTGILDGGGNSMLAFTPAASAVDGFTLTNAATANPATVTLAATGSDSNIIQRFLSKGTGNFFFDMSSGNNKTVFGASAASAAGSGHIWIEYLLGPGFSRLFADRGGSQILLEGDGLYLGSGVPISFDSTTGITGAFDAGLGRNAAGVVEANNGTLGTFRDIRVRAVRHTALTIATLPTGAAGMTAYVTDGDSSLAWGATVVNSGGGATKYLVFFNGTNWTVAGK